MKHKVKYTVLDLFSGIGGLHSGFKDEGFEISLAIDFDENCEKTHKSNYPEIRFIKKDIRLISNEEIKALVGNKIDVLLGGPPCQGFSTIGNRASSNPYKRKKRDSRNDLFNEYIRILNLIKPKFFLMENVKGLLTKDSGRVFERIKKEYVKTGYYFDYSLLDVVDFGVPQFRKRVFFYGNKYNIKMTPPNKTCGALSTSKPYKTVGESIMDLVGKENRFANHSPLYHRDKNIKRYSYIPEGGRLPEQNLPVELYRKNFGNTFKRLDRKKPSLTMVPGHNAFPIHPTLNRSLTVREAARLQTFPDTFIFMGSRQSQCTQVGNAVPVQMARAWAKHIKGYLESMSEK